MASKVAVVTDSTATIPQDLLDKYDIKVGPQVLIWGAETLLDGVDIQPKEFYERLKKDPIHPTTSQVTPAIFLDIFSQLLEQDCQVLAVLISPKLSGTIASAQQAKEQFPGAPIEIVDSQSHYGAELSLDYRPGEAWYFRLDGSWASHTYDSAINLLGSSGNLNGNTIEGAPETFGSARVGWNFPALEARDGTLELEWVYLDSYYLDPENEHQYSGHSLLNLRLSGMVDPRWRASLRITNLLDEDYAERADFGFGPIPLFCRRAGGRLPGSHLPVRRLR